VGLNNAHHEPINFFGTVRPEGETSIIPNTWHETGLSIMGQFGRRWASFDYQAMVVAGLNANGFERNAWVKKGKQGFFEVDNFTSPAYVARLNYRGIPGLRLGASFYYLYNAASNSDKPQTYNFRVPVRIWSVDAQYQHRYFIARGNVMGGYVGNSSQLTNKNNRLSSKSPYSRLVPIAERAVSYAAEAGLRLRNMVVSDRMPDLIPFARYEYYNPQEKVVVDAYNVKGADPRLKTSMWVAGLNYRPLPNLIIKADYTKRRIGDGNYKSENEFALGVAFTGWFLSDNRFAKIRNKHHKNEETSK
jgi:opacity protein-like surface antigen